MKRAIPFSTIELRKARCITDVTLIHPETESRVWGQTLEARIDEH
jgi:hypothetical protein